MANSLSRKYFLDTGSECSRKEFIQQEINKGKTKSVISEETGIPYDAVSDVVDSFYREITSPPGNPIEDQTEPLPEEPRMQSVRERINVPDIDDTPKKRCNMGKNCQHPDGPLLPITQFNKRSASPDKLSYTCKECEKIRSRFNYSRRKKVPTEKLPPRVTPEHRERILEPAPEEKVLPRIDDVKMAVISRCVVDGMLTCGNCLRPILRARDMVIAHVVPLEDGGADEVSNMHCVHKNCEAYDDEQ